MFGFLSLIPAKNSLMSCVGNLTRNCLRSGANLATNPHSKPEPSLISLYFPWVTGNKVQRRVRSGLPPQPAEYCFRSYTYFRHRGQYAGGVLLQVGVAEKRGFPRFTRGS